MWPLTRGLASSRDPLAELSRKCQLWDRELAKSEAAVADTERHLAAKTKALDDFEELLTKIERDQIVFDQLISDFEQSPPSTPDSSGDPLDDAKCLAQALDDHNADLARMHAGPRTHREFLCVLADLEQHL
jgi:hypothetical protein